MGRHLPPNIPVEKIEGIYRQKLQKLSDSLIEKIHEFIKISPEESVESAEFQVFPDEYGEGESTIWMYFEGKDKKIDKNDQRLFAGRSLEMYSDFSSLPTLDIEAYEDLNFPNMIADLIIEWFAECWWKAGGWYYPVPVEIFGHEGFGSGEIIPLTKIKP
jgi:hypothetical protein